MRTPEQTARELLDMISDEAAVDRETVLKATNLFEQRVIDSLTLVRLILHCESAYGVSILPDEAANVFKSVDHAVNYIHSAQFN